jgi:hypothetical protein
MVPCGRDGPRPARLAPTTLDPADAVRENRSELLAIAKAKTGRQREIESAVIAGSHRGARPSDVADHHPIGRIKFLAMVDLGGIPLRKIASNGGRS